MQKPSKYKLLEVFEYKFNLLNSASCEEHPRHLP